MSLKLKQLTFFISVWLFCGAVFAGEMGHMPQASHPFYVGVNGGYGSTTWKGLVPNLDNQNVVLSMSTPIDVQEGGWVWGGMVGFEFLSNWGVEFNYLHFPTATVFFDPGSFFSFDNEGETTLSTKTEALSLMAKVMVPVPNTLFRAYSSVGVGWIHRDDVINEMWLAVPAFGVGVNYALSEHFMAEVAANYLSGYGESELSPANNYIPFLYAVYARLAYRI